MPTSTVTRSDSMERMMEQIIGQCADLAAQFQSVGVGGPDQPTRTRNGSRGTVGDSSSHSSGGARIDLGTLPGVSTGEKAWLVQRAVLLNSATSGLVGYHGRPRLVSPLAKETVKRIDGLPEAARSELSDLRGLASRLAEDYSYQSTATYRWLGVVHQPGDLLSSLLCSGVGSGCSAAASPVGACSGSSVSALPIALGHADPAESACAAGAATCLGVTGGAALCGGLVTLGVGLTVNSLVGAVLGLPGAAVTKLADAFSGKATEKAIAGYYEDRRVAGQITSAAITDGFDKTKKTFLAT